MRKTFWNNCKLYGRANLSKYEDSPAAELITGLSELRPYTLEKLRRIDKLQIWWGIHVLYVVAVIVRQLAPSDKTRWQKAELAEYLQWVKGPLWRNEPIMKERQSEPEIKTSETSSDEIREAASRSEPPKFGDCFDYHPSFRWTWKDTPEFQKRIAEIRANCDADNYLATGEKR